MCMFELQIGVVFGVVKELIHTLTGIEELRLSFDGFPRLFFLVS